MSSSSSSFSAPSSAPSLITPDEELSPTKILNSEEDGGAESYQRGEEYFLSQDYEKSFKYHAEAVKQGNTFSYPRLGYFYDRGAVHLNSDPDINQAISCYKKAIEFTTDIDKLKINIPSLVRLIQIDKKNKADYWTLLKDTLILSNKKEDQGDLLYLLLIVGNLAKELSNGSLSLDKDLELSLELYKEILSYKERIKNQSDIVSSYFNLIPQAITRIEETKKIATPPQTTPVKNSNGDTNVCVTPSSASPPNHESEQAVVSNSSFFNGSIDMSLDYSSRNNPPKTPLAKNSSTSQPGSESKEDLDFNESFFDILLNMSRNYNSSNNNPLNEKNMESDNNPNESLLNSSRMSLSSPPTFFPSRFRVNARNRNSFTASPLVLPTFLTSAKEEEQQPNTTPHASSSSSTFTSTSSIPSGKLSETDTAGSSFENFDSQATEDLAQDLVLSPSSASSPAGGKPTSSPTPPSSLDDPENSSVFSSASTLAPSTTPSSEVQMHQVEQALLTQLQEVKNLDTQPGKWTGNKLDLLCFEKEKGLGFQINIKLLQKVDFSSAFEAKKQESALLVEEFKKTFSGENVYATFKDSNNNEKNIFLIDNVCEMTEADGLYPSIPTNVGKKASADDVDKFQAPLEKVFGIDLSLKTEVYKKLRAFIERTEKELPVLYLSFLRGLEFVVFLSQNWENLNPLNEWWIGKVKANKVPEDTMSLMIQRLNEDVFQQSPQQAAEENSEPNADQLPPAADGQPESKSSDSANNLAADTADEFANFESEWHNPELFIRQPQGNLHMPTTNPSTKKDKQKTNDSIQKPVEVKLVTTKPVTTATAAKTTTTTAPTIAPTISINAPVNASNTPAKNQEDVGELNLFEDLDIAQPDVLSTTNSALDSSPTAATSSTSSSSSVATDVSTTHASVSALSSTAASSTIAAPVVTPVSSSSSSTTSGSVDSVVVELALEATDQSTGEKLKGEKKPHVDEAPKMTVAPEELALLPQATAVNQSHTHTTSSSSSESSPVSTVSPSHESKAELKAEPKAELTDPIKSPQSEVASNEKSAAASESQSDENHTVVTVSSRPKHLSRVLTGAVIGAIVSSVALLAVKVLFFGAALSALVASNPFLLLMGAVAFGGALVVGGISGIVSHRLSKGKKGKEAPAIDGSSKENGNNNESSKDPETHRLSTTHVQQGLGLTQAQAQQAQQAQPTVPVPAEKASRILGVSSPVPAVTPMSNEVLKTYQTDPRSPNSENNQEHVSNNNPKPSLP